MPDTSCIEVRSIIAIQEHTTAERFLNPVFGWRLLCHGSTTGSYNNRHAPVKLPVRGEYDYPPYFRVASLWIEHLSKHNVTIANSAHSMEPPPTTERQSSSSSSNQA